MNILLSNYYMEIRGKPDLLFTLKESFQQMDIPIKITDTTKGMRIYASYHTLYELLLKLSFNYDIELT